MKVKCIADDRENLTVGKVYEVMECKEVIMQKTMYRVKDDHCEEYLYEKDNFEIVEE